MKMRFIFSHARRKSIARNALGRFSIVRSKVPPLKYSTIITMIVSGENTYYFAKSI